MAKEYENSVDSIFNMFIGLGVLALVLLILGMPIRLLYDNWGWLTTNINLTPYKNINGLIIVTLATGTIYLIGRVINRPIFTRFHIVTGYVILIVFALSVETGNAVMLNAPEYYFKFSHWLFQ